MSTPFGVGDAKFRTGGSAGHVDTVAFGAYRRDALEEIGLFDVALSRNQDDELNYRLLKSGWRIWFDPRISSQYHVRSTYRNLVRQYYQYGYWKVFVNLKHRTITTWRQTVPALFLLVLLERVPAGWRKLWATGTTCGMVLERPSSSPRSFFGSFWAQGLPLPLPGLTETCRASSGPMR